MSTAVTYAVNAIRMLIEEHLQPDDRLPSENELVERLGVSRSTVRDALARLAAEGVVEKQWGVGTFVAHTRPRTALGILSIRPGVPGLLATTGGTPSVYRFTFSEEPPDPAQFPDFPNTPLLSLLRVFALDGVPAIAILDRLVSEFNGRRIDPGKLRSPGVLVADVISEVGIEFRMLEGELVAENLDKAGRSIFDLSRTEPVIQTRARGYDAYGRQILAARGIYRTRVVELRLSVP